MIIAMKGKAWCFEITGRKFHWFKGQGQGLEVLDVKNDWLLRT